MDYDDDDDWPTTVRGCGYEIITVGGAIVGTGVVALGLWYLVAAALEALLLCR